MLSHAAAPHSRQCFFPYAIWNVQLFDYFPVDVEFQIKTNMHQRHDYNFFLTGAFLWSFSKNINSGFMEINRKSNQNHFLMTENGLFFS